MIPEAILTSIRIYPLKSAGGVEVDEATIERHGFAMDRRWMLVDERGAFLTQRVLPRIALLRPQIRDEELHVAAPGHEAFRLPVWLEEGERIPVRIWGDDCSAFAATGAASSWFAEVLGVRCRPVYLPDDALRTVDPDYAEMGDRVGFADGFPFLLASTASLDDLNARAGTSLPMDRFRPNLVVTGTDAFAEDGWARIRIGDVRFRVAKPCSRCVTTTVDQGTAEVGKEPLKTLATFRKVGSKVMFGQNLIHDGVGTLRVGDPVVVEESFPATTMDSGSLLELNS